MLASEVTFSATRCAPSGSSAIASRLMSEAQTLTPSFSKPLAIACPRPLPAPVTSAVLARLM